MESSFQNLSTVLSISAMLQAYRAAKDESSPNLHLPVGSTSSRGNKCKMHPSNCKLALQHSFKDFLSGQPSGNIARPTSAWHFGASGNRELLQWQGTSQKHGRTEALASNGGLSQIAKLLRSKYLAAHQLYIKWYMVLQLVL